MFLYDFFSVICNSQLITKQKQHNRIPQTAASTDFKRTAVPALQKRVRRGFD